ncbi:MAG: hypothetical protein ABFD75_09490 [Smithella sp.]
MSEFQYKYILFTHLPYNNKAWDLLDSKAARLSECLKSQEAPGMLVVFLDVGWLSLLNTIGTDFDPVKMAEEFYRIDEIEKRVKKLKTDLKDRLRLVTAKTLNPILNNLRGNKPGLEATRLKNFLVGNDPGVRYDTTKVAEAIIRVRHLGSGIPVLRMDWDALLSDNTLDKRLLDVVTRDITKYCNELSVDHRIHSYMISGSYTQPKDKSICEWDINDFNTAFATRMFPALILNQNAIRILNENANNKEKKDGELTEKLLSDYENNLFDCNTMIKYYGLDSPDDPDKGLQRLGSNPRLSVVSGAGLVISEGAILDLPPFSNFRQNVMWIDDHLKYELHRALGHFSKVRSIIHSRNGDVEPSRHPDAEVFKDRILAGQGNLRPYALGVYIPTLFWGILVDAWIRGEPPAPKVQSPFVATLEKALKRGIFEKSDRGELKKELEKIAIKRINKVIELWSSLKCNKGQSFAELWVGGDKDNIKEVLSGLKSQDEAENWLGWGLLKERKLTIDTLTDLREPIRKIVDQLMDDMCTYIDWTLEWPKFIQSVRAVKKGSLELDVS